MEAGTQSALIMIWALFWMLALSLMMVHPMFRATRVQIRRSLRLNLNRWRTAQQRMRARMLRVRGRLLIKMGRSLLWLARQLEQKSSSPFWMRALVNLSFHTLFMYLFWHLICRQPMTWAYFFGYLSAVWTMDGVKAWRKRRKQRAQETPPTDSSSLKPAEAQRAEP